MPAYRFRAPWSQDGNNSREGHSRSTVTTLQPICRDPYWHEYTLAVHFSRGPVDPAAGGSVPLPRAQKNGRHQSGCRTADESEQQHRFLSVGGARELFRHDELLHHRRAWPIHGAHDRRSSEVFWLLIEGSEERISGVCVLWESTVQDRPSRSLPQNDNAVDGTSDALRSNPRDRHLSPGANAPADRGRVDNRYAESHEPGACHHALCDPASVGSMPEPGIDGRLTFAASPLL